MRIQTLLILAATLTLGLEAQAGTINVQFNNATNYTGPAVISSGSNSWSHGTGGIVVDSTGAVVLAGGSGVTVSLGGAFSGFSTTGTFQGALTNSYLYTTSSAFFTISGLRTNQAYSMVVLAYDNAGFATGGTFSTVAGGTDGINDSDFVSKSGGISSWINRRDYVLLDVQTGSLGTLTTTLTRGANEVAVNGFQLTEVVPEPGCKSPEPGSGFRCTNRHGSIPCA